MSRNMHMYMHRFAMVVMIVVMAILRTSSTVHRAHAGQVSPSVLTQTYAYQGCISVTETTTAVITVTKILRTVYQSPVILVK